MKSIRSVSVTRALSALRSQFDRTCSSCRSPADVPYAGTGPAGFDVDASAADIITNAVAAMNDSTAAFRPTAIRVLLTAFRMPLAKYQIAWNSTNEVRCVRYTNRQEIASSLSAAIGGRT
jgi:hypothetical protein